MDGETMVEREEGPRGGRYVIRLEGDEAEMTYSLSGDAMVIDHTGVPPAFQNRGLAAKLVESAIADARKEGRKIVPVCSYVAAHFRRHPQAQDVWKR